MLSGVVSGVNTEGDAWVLRLIGPGTIQVTKQPDASGNATSLLDPSEINTITLQGTSATQSRLVGTVVPSGVGTGEVFFQNLTLGANTRLTGEGNEGLLSIDMPQFYLGLTAADAPTSTNGGTEPSISIPGGVETLDFGGVDTTAFFGADAANNLQNNGQSDQFTVNIGIPVYSGVRIIVNKIITTGEANTSTSGSSSAPYQDGVTFTVNGRLGLFQANEIDGNTTYSPGLLPSTGGTIINSTEDTASATIGQIGFVRVGDNATNLFVETDDKIHQVFIGGETNNVSILAPDGARDLYFGEGFDQSEILAHTIDDLFANRGAIGSTIISDRQIGNAEFGGDVVSTTVKAGYYQDLSSVYTSPSTAPTPVPQYGGNMRVTVAGDITNSVFASATSPDPTTNDFGTINDQSLPGSAIKARVEGTISNTTAVPSNPTAAFFAQTVKLTHGPVTPPTVNQPPYSGELTPTSLPGVPRPYAYARKK